MSLCNLLNWGLPRCQGEGSFWLPPPQSYQARGCTTCSSSCW